MAPSSAVLCLLLLSIFILSQKEANAATFDYVPRPEFADPGPELNVTSYLSQTSRIPCRVRHLGNKKVSWIRGRDLQVISSGRTMFISDIRVSILPGASSKRFKKRGVNQVTGGSFETRIRFTDSPKIAPEALNHLEDSNKSGRAPSGIRERRGFLKNTERGRAKRNSKLVHSELHRDHSYAYRNRPIEEETRVLRDPYQSLHRKKIKKRTKKLDTHPTNDFDKLSYDNINDYYADESSSILKPKNESIRLSRQRKDLTQTPSSPEGLKNTFLQNASNKKTYRRKNEILNPDEISRELENPDGTLKNPIFIRPLGSSNDVKEELKPRHIQLPYNYLDAFWEPEDFTLQIKYTRADDAGTYLCQINTEPGMTQIVHLRVVEMIANIEGPKELFVKEGSPVVLTCKVTHGDELPGFIFWYKNDLLVDYDSTKGRIEVDMSVKSQSKLILKEADRTDSANYTCAPSGGKPDVVTLSVIAEKHPEAVQQSDGCSPNRGGANWKLSILLPSVILALTKSHQRQIGHRQHS